MVILKVAQTRRLERLQQSDDWYWFWSLLGELVLKFRKHQRYPVRAAQGPTTGHPVFGRSFGDRVRMAGTPRVWAQPRVNLRLHSRFPDAGLPGLASKQPSLWRKKPGVMHPAIHYKVNPFRGLCSQIFLPPYHPSKVSEEGRASL